MYPPCVGGLLEATGEILTQLMKPRPRVSPRVLPRAWERCATARAEETLENLSWLSDSLAAVSFEGFPTYAISSMGISGQK